MYIIIRRSLKLSKGKVGAQCGHAVQYMMLDDAVPGDRHPPKEEIDLRIEDHAPRDHDGTGKERLRQIDEEREQRSRTRQALPAMGGWRPRQDLSWAPPTTSS